jgi:MFS family permease
MTAEALPEGARRAYQANIARYFAFETLQSFQLWFPIWIIYLQQQRHLSLTEITLLDTPFFLIQVLAEVPTGAVADRFGRKTSLLLGAAITTVGVFVFGVAENYPIILVSYVFWGVGMTLQSGADQAFLYDSLKLLGREAEYSRIFGRANAFAMTASIVASVLGSPIAARTSLAFPVVVSSFIYGASALVALTFKEPPQLAERPTYLQTVTDGIGQVARRPVLILVMVFGVTAGLTFFVAQYFMQPFLKGHGASTASLGLIMLPQRLASVAASFGAHRVEQRLGSWRALALTPVISILGCAGLAAWDSIYAFAFIPLISAAGTTRLLLVSHYINQRIGSEHRATVVSIYALLTALSASLCAPLFGYLADSHSLRFLYGSVATFAAVTLPFIVLLWWRAERREEGAPDAIQVAKDALPASE